MAERRVYSMERHVDKSSVSSRGYAWTPLSYHLDQIQEAGAKRTKGSSSITWLQISDIERCGHDPDVRSSYFSLCRSTLYLPSGVRA